MSTTVDNSAIDRRIDELTRSWMPSPAQSNLDEALEPTISELVAQAMAANAGGKRLRARLALTAYEVGTQATGHGSLLSETTTLSGHHGDNAGDSNGADNDTDTNTSSSPQTLDPHDAMLDLACAIEIHQTSALIHDDIIDDSPLRRGRASSHTALTQTTGNKQMGTGLALMLGNMLATASASIAANALTNHGLANQNAGISAFLDMQRAIEIGQSLDLAAERLPLSQPETLARASLNVFAWKTASYTTIAPLMLGLTSAGMEPDKAKRTAREIGLPLGVAFQLADDLIDVIGTSASTGKPVGGDIREGKRTVLLADALTHANASDRQTLIDIYESPKRDEEDVRKVLDLFASTGAIDASRERIAQLWRDSSEAIDKAFPEAASRNELKEMCRQFIPESLR
ncbi:polyprenyl synthetase family protein [Bifidobacterium sp. ESL0790]|uniref:polyprenyl synthetase family protein n=1 Tax=Bifidobacterium sp. ESL0790 TaxID=2983233 RepID=UPI0023F6EA2D|nr:polyprenyl synthetase family protein [Bifidobacterium sp. ESL0790]WEV72940.1 polyprenyl synthetase family protein [Bifidobacterium sp. ESL0790]